MTPNGGRRRIVLALLACRPGSPVPVDELVESAWPAARPVRPRKAVQLLMHGIWLVPGSPYPDDEAVIDAIHTVRTNRVPHAESDGEGEDNAVVPLACSLHGEESEVRPVPGSRFAGWVPEPVIGMHFPF